MLLLQPALVPSANPLGLKGPSRFRWTTQPRCRHIGLTLRVTITGDRPTVDGLAQRNQDVAGPGPAEEDERGQKDERKSALPLEEEKKRGAHPLKGRKRSTEVVAKIVASKMRNREPHSEETKEKMRQAHLNKRHTLVTRIKISKSRAGQRHSEETRRRMSIARKQYWENWHQEKMSLQAAEPSKDAGDLNAESLEGPHDKVPRPKRKAWYKQNSERNAAEE